MYSPRYKISDGGRVQEGFVKEKLDCTVISLALALGISYTQAHTILAQYGRKDGKRLDPSFNVFMSKIYPNIPHTYIQRGQRHRVRTLLENNWYERAVFHIAHHVFCIVDNTVLDGYPTLNKNCVVTDIWDFSNYSIKS